MAAPTNAVNVKKALANSEPSTHGTNRNSSDVRYTVANGINRTWCGQPISVENDPRTGHGLLLGPALAVTSFTVI
jgi:hypothetical protein